MIITTTPKKTYKIFDASVIDIRTHTPKSIKLSTQVSSTDERKTNLRIYRRKCHRQTSTLTIIIMNNNQKAVNINNNDNDT